MERERLRGEALAVEQPEHERQARLTVCDVDPHDAVHEARLAHEGLGGEQLADELRGRVDADRDDVTGDGPLELGPGTARDDAAVVDDGQAVAQRVRLIEVVGRQEHGGAAVPQAADLVPHSGSRLGVKPGRRLVEEQHDRAVDHPQPDIEPAAHAPGVGLDRPVAGVGQVQRLEQLRRPGVGIRAREAEQATLHHQLATAAHPRIRAAGLRDVADPPTHRLRVPGHVVAGDTGDPGGRQEERGEDPERGRLAGTVGAEEAEDRAGLNVQIDTCNRLDDVLLLAERASQALGHDDGLTHRRPRPAPRSRARARGC